MEEEQDVNAEAAKEETFEQYEAKYLLIYSTLLKEIRSRQGQPENTHNTLEQLAGQQTKLPTQLGSIIPNQNDVALPKIVIPPFSGEYNKWVDSKPHLTKTQKFYYLISYLNGEAEDLIKNIPIAEDHYMEA